MNTISYSRMNTYTTCPLKWYKQYIEGKKPKRIPAFAFGNAVHKYIQGSLLKKPYSLSAEDYTKVSTEEELKENIEATKILGKAALDYVLNEDDFGIISFDALGLTEDNIEKQFKLFVGNGYFKGYIDLWFVNSRGEIIIIDWKTTSQEYKVHQIRSSQQLTGYAYGFKRMYDRIPDKEIYVTLNKKDMNIKHYVATRTEQDLIDMETKLQAVLSEMEAEINYKNENGCYTGPECKWRCDFYKECWDCG